MTNEDHSSRWDASELQLKDAIAHELAELNPDDEGILVTDYVVVAETLDRDGNKGTRYTLTDTASLSDILGWLRYADIVFSTKLRNNVTRIDRGE